MDGIELKKNDGKCGENMAFMLEFTVSSLVHTDRRFSFPATFSLLAGCSTDVQVIFTDVQTENADKTKGEWKPTQFLFSFVLRESTLFSL